MRGKYIPINYSSFKHIIGMVTSTDCRWSTRCQYLDPTALVSRISMSVLALCPPLHQALLCSLVKSAAVRTILAQWLDNVGQLSAIGHGDWRRAKPCTEENHGACCVPVSWPFLHRVVPCTGSHYNPDPGLYSEQCTG